MMKKQKIMLYRIIAAAVNLCSSFCTGTYGKTGISVRNSGAVFVIYDTLSDPWDGTSFTGLCAISVMVRYLMRTF